MHTCSSAMSVAALIIAAVQVMSRLNDAGISPAPSGLSASPSSAQQSTAHVLSQISPAPAAAPSQASMANRPDVSRASVASSQPANSHVHEVQSATPLPAQPPAPNFDDEADAASPASHLRSHALDGATIESPTTSADSSVAEAPVSQQPAELADRRTQALQLSQPDSNCACPAGHAPQVHASLPNLEHQAEAGTPGIRTPGGAAGAEQRNSAPACPSPLQTDAQKDTSDLQIDAAACQQDSIASGADVASGAHEQGGHATGHAEVSGSRSRPDVQDSMVVHAPSSIAVSVQSAPPRSSEDLAEAGAATVSRQHNHDSMSMIPLPSSEVSAASMQSKQPGSLANLTEDVHQSASVVEQDQVQADTSDAASAMASACEPAESATKQVLTRLHKSRADLQTSRHA
jgi:hypothetical protein